MPTKRDKSDKQLRKESLKLAEINPDKIITAGHRYGLFFLMKEKSGRKWWQILKPKHIFRHNFEGSFKSVEETVAYLNSKKGLLETNKDIINISVIELNKK